MVAATLSVSEALRTVDAMVGARHYQLALANLRHLAGQLGPNADVQRRLGWCAFLSGDDAEAQRCLGAAVAAGDGESVRLLGLAIEHRGLPVGLRPAQMEIEALRHSVYMDYPREVNVETLAVCNAACTFCPYPTIERKGTSLPMELIERIIDGLAEIPRHVPFTISPFKVNDPFLDTRIYEVCAKMNARLPNAGLRLFTNGTPLNQRMLDRVNALERVTHLWVSLNHFEADAYQALMGLPFERTIRKLDFLHDAVAKGHFRYPVVVSRVCDGTDTDLRFHDFVSARFPQFRIQLIGRGDWTGSISTYREVLPIACDRWFELSIMATGKVALCCMDGEGKVVVGDVAKQSVLEIYNSPGYRKMREHLPTRLGAQSPCDTCSY